MSSIFGFQESSIGLGEAARRLRSLLFASGLDIDPARQSKEVLGKPVASDLGFFSVNPDQLLRFGSQFEGHRTRVGFWAWELEQVPNYFSRSAALFDLVLSISKFTESALLDSGIANMSVSMPVPMPMPASVSVSRKNDGDKSRSRSEGAEFSVLVTFDFSSDLRRKNPEAAISAYKMAFEEKANAALLVKTIGGTKRQITNLRRSIEDRRDIHLLTSTLESAHFESLVREADVLMSLHRSEGYGLNLADAMARKVPVIATGYSGNLDFMDDNSSILVPYKLVPVNFYAGLPIKSVWAEPDIEFAALKLRELYEDENLRREIGEAGYKKILTEHSLPFTVKKFQEEFMNG